MVQKKFFTEVVLLTKSYNLQDFKDWMHWHLDIIGFQRCHVFDNESSVDIKSVCDSYGDRVTYELIKGWPNQYALYNRYINNESPAWWVLPIDDDEFLYISNDYANNVNTFIMHLQQEHPNWNKLCIGWRNMFPHIFTHDRLHPCLIENALAWSNEASSIWQAGNRPVKTFVNTIYNYDWADRNKQHRTHNPFVLPCDQVGHTWNGEDIRGSWQNNPTLGTEPIILFHYQFKCNFEWWWKCRNRVSPGSHDFKKNVPLKYIQLYNTSNKLHIDRRMVDLWNG